MSRWLITLLIGGLFIVPSATVYAQDDYSSIYSYVGGGLHHWSTNNSSAEGLKLRFGQSLSPFLGAEVQLAIGGEDSETEVSLERMFGLYGKFSLPLDALSFYAKLGLTSAAIEVAAETETEFEIGYGLGVEVNLNKRFYLDFEYMSYLDTATMELEGFTFGLGYKLP